MIKEMIILAGIVKKVSRKVIIEPYDDVMEMKKRVMETDISFNEHGIDPYGLSVNHLTAFYLFLKTFYRRYFRIKTYGMENIPEGPGMLIGNHSGGLPADGGMVVVSMIIDKEKPRVVHSMVDKFVFHMPVVSTWFSRVGQFSGQPDVARRLLKEGRLLLVFPEGVKGIGKAIPNRYKMAPFNTGFMRIAMQTGVPVIPFAYIGGEESTPVIMRSKLLGKLSGSPFVPVTPYVVPWPLPVSCQIYYGEPMYFKGTGHEREGVVKKYVEKVQDKVEELIETGCSNRNSKKLYLVTGKEEEEDII